MPRLWWTIFPWRQRGHTHTGAFTIRPRPHRQGNTGVSSPQVAAMRNNELVDSVNICFLPAMSDIGAVAHC